MKDKVKNEKRKLLEWLENKELNIVNRRKEKYRQKNCTYISGRGCTVIDSIITNKEQYGRRNMQDRKRIRLGSPTSNTSYW